VEPVTSLPTFDEPTAPSTRIGARRILGLIWRAIRLTWIAAPRELLANIALQIATAAATVGALFLGRNVLAEVVVGTGRQSVGDLAPEIVGLALFLLATAAATSTVFERQRIMAALVERHVLGRVLDVVARVPLAEFEDPSFHDRLRRAMFNASERSYQVTIAILGFLSAFAMLVPLALVLARIQPLVLPAVVLAYLPLHLATTRNGRAAYDLFYWLTTTDREREYLGRVLATAEAAKEVRLFSSDTWLRSRYDELYEERIHQLRKLTRTRVVRSLVANAWSTAITIAGIALLVDWARTGRLSAADTGIAAVIVQQIGTRMRSLGSSVGTLHESGLFLDDVISFVQPLPEPAEPGASAAVPERFEELRVEHLSFTYPGTDRRVLDDVSLEIGRSEVVALVGANGSGKTTLAKVLLGLYEPTGGRVLWDDLDTAAFDVAELRRRMAAAFQDFVTYELSGQLNIGLGDPPKLDDLDAIRLAAQAAGAHDRLVRLPDGYATRLSRAYDDGADLSVGEWQRVALARAFLRDAPLLVLDEPTASLDPHAESELFAAMRQLQQGRAVLLISHRFPSVRSADRIYVLDRGSVIESGTHASLMAQGGRYAEMFTLQADAYLRGDEVP
jgi:ATP-binding cassette subfamily B protein